MHSHCNLGTLQPGHCDLSSNATPPQVTLNDNAGTGDGGAINSVGDNVNITACAFNRNTAARGGAMYTQDGATVAIKQVRRIEQHAC
jgi:predicted outer membrane repeat protein